MMLAGCGVQGDEYQPRRVSAEKSVVYLYRPFKVLGSSATPLVTCGHESIEMEPGGYYSFDEETGPVVCTAAGAEYKFDARPGEQYFIREDVDTSGHVRFKLMDADVGRDQIKECNRQGIKQ